MNITDFLDNLESNQSSQEVKNKLNSIESQIGSVSASLNGLPDRLTGIINRASAAGGSTQSSVNPQRPNILGADGKSVNLGDTGSSGVPSPEINRAANEIRNYINEFRSMGNDFIKGQQQKLNEEKARLERVKKSEGESSAKGSEATRELAIVEENSKALEKLAAALPNLAARIDSSGKDTAKNISSIVSQVAGALMLQQLMTMANITLPYQYQTKPALSALGSSGMMGELLSGALGAQESVMQGFREMTPGITAGAGALIGSKFGAPGMLLGGALGGLAGTIPQVNDMLAGALDYATGNFSEKAFQTSLGSSLLDANKFKDITLASLIPQLAFSNNFSGNTVDFLQAGVSDEAKAMGFDPMKSAQFTTSVLTSVPLSALNPNNLSFQTADAQNFEDRDRASVTGLLNLSAALESRGMTTESSLDLYSTLARAGSEDIIKSVSTLVSATSQDGVATDYTLNVLVPALSRVVESRSIANISRSSEEIERGTAGVFSFIKSSGTRLADLIEKNPNAVLSQVFGMIDQVGESALNDPARMMFLNQLGIPFMDVIGKKEDMLYKPVEFFRNMASFDSDGTINKEQSFFTAMQMLNVLGIQMTGTNLQYAFSMLEAGGDSDRVSEIMQEMGDNDPLTRIAEALEKFIGTEEGTILTRITQQAEQYYTALTDNVDNILAMQHAIEKAMEDSATVSAAVDVAMYSFISSIADMIERSGNLEAANEIRELLKGITKPPETGLMADIKNLAESLIEDLGTAVSSFSSSIGNIVSDITTGVMDGIKEFFDGLIPRFGASAPMGVEDFMVSALGEVSETTGALVGMNPLENGALTDFLSVAASGVNNSEVTQTSNLLLALGHSTLENGALNHGISAATGGFTGIGGRLEPVGIVHGGEYVISDTRVPGNRITLDRMMSGENFDEQTSALTNSENGNITVTLEFSNTNPSAIIDAAVNASRNMLQSERILG